MIELFDEKKSYKLPNGETISGTELQNRDSYKMLKSYTCVLKTYDGVIYTITPLGAFCESYGVEYDEDNKELSFENALAAKKEKEEYDKIHPVDNMPTILYSVARVAQITAMSFTDEQALEVKDIYPEYQVDHAYKQGDFFTHEGELYKVNQAHTSASQWEPGSVGTESLYTHLTLNEDGYPIWKQPTGAHDAYNKGDIVEYNGELYKSLIDGNAYSPDAYPAGWEKYTEPEA